MTATTDTGAYERALAYAREEGKRAGESAASWYFDGNTTDATYRAVLDGLDAGDPAILDTLPAPDLSGEWADTLTGPHLVADALRAAGAPHDGIPYGHAPGTCETCDTFDASGDICDAYESAFSEAAEAAIAAAARAILA